MGESEIEQCSALRGGAVRFDGSASRVTETTGGEGRAYGYARVSSRDQNLDRQIDALVEGASPRRTSSRIRRAARTSSVHATRRCFGSCARGMCW